MSNSGALIAIGLGAVVAAVVIATNKKKQTPTYDPSAIRRTSPGQPQPISYVFPGGAQQVSFS